MDLLRISALRNLKARYRGSALGVLWSFANPVLMTFLYAAIFGSSFRHYYNGSLTQYVLSAFVGVVAISLFSQATGEAMTSIVANGGLLNKIALPSWMFPIASVAANAFQQTITTFPALILISLTVTHDPIRVVLVPIVIAAFLLLVAGFGLALAALFVFFRDLQYLWGVVNFILWITSPVFYPAAFVPDAVRPWLAFNPIGLSIAALRDVTIGRGPIELGTLAVFFAVCAVSACAGTAVFAAMRREFMDLL
jgi:ABC-type polysaccharide/polyol phosphate export permease